MKIKETAALMLMAGVLALAGKETAAKTAPESISSGAIKTQQQGELLETKAEEIRIRETEKVKDLIEAAEESKKAEEEAAEQEPKKAYYKDFTLTAYIATGNPCADGVYPTAGHTAACNDPALWHKWIEVEGYGVYYVHDTGGMSSSVIDIFVGSYDEAIQFGRRSAGVYILE